MIGIHIFLLYPRNETYQPVSLFWFFFIFYIFLLIGVVFLAFVRHRQVYRDLSQARRQSTGDVSHDVDKVISFMFMVQIWSTVFIVIVYLIGVTALRQENFFTYALFFTMPLLISMPLFIISGMHKFNYREISWLSLGVLLVFFLFWPGASALSRGALYFFNQGGGVPVMVHLKSNGKSDYKDDQFRTLEQDQLYRNSVGPYNLLLRGNSKIYVTKKDTPECKLIRDYMDDSKFEQCKHSFSIPVDQVVSITTYKPQRSR
jgi:hypothetical protein